MNIDAYDFDKTIYDGDSSIDFYLYSLNKNKKNIYIIFLFSWYYILYIFKRVDKVKLKEIFFSFLKNIDNVSLEVNKFWEKYEYKIKKFYNEKENHSNDIIISASPEFLLKPICEKMKVKDLIASEVNSENGIFLSKNCKGQEKLIKLKNKYENIIIDNFYTDSYSDQPLIDFSKNAFMVSKNKITKIK